MRRLLIILGAAALLGACGGRSQIGASCRGAAVENACVDGAICARERSTTEAPPNAPNGYTYVCRALCENEADCTDPNLHCRAVTDAPMQSACQPDESGPLGSDGGSAAGSDAGM